MIRRYKGICEESFSEICGYLVFEENEGQYYIDKYIPEMGCNIKYWVISESISQSTGEFDKNNNEVFENDDVKFYMSGKPHVCKVIYKYGMHCLLYKDGYVNHYPIDFKNMEIIKL